MRTLAILAGGDSSEFEISVKSANAVMGALEGKYHLYLIMIKGRDWYWEDPSGKYIAVDKNTFTLKLPELRVRFDGVFIAIHGTPGENGLLQGYFDMMRIPYSSCSAFSSALTFNKHACKLYLREYGIPMAESILLPPGENYDADEIIQKTGLPCFVKPNESGSSFGVSKVEKHNELFPALEKAFRESKTVMVEAIMAGTETACGVIGIKDKTIILPVTEIISKKDFFDYEAKYTPGFAEEITPARLPEKVYQEIQILSERAFSLLDCKGIIRVDFIVVDNKPMFLEINSIPGMTNESIIPRQIEVYGASPTEIYSMVVEDMLGV